MMDKTKRASVEFTVSYKSDFGYHSDRLHIPRVDFWRDLFPGNMGVSLGECKENESISESFFAGEIVEPYAEDRVVLFHKSKLSGGEGVANETNMGRYYPKSRAWKAMNAYPGDKAPFRIIDRKDGKYLADANHPLAKYNLNVKAKLLKFYPEKEQRGGSFNVISELFCDDGPGMQVPLSTFEGGLFDSFHFTRELNDDASFYSKSRITHHLDSRARKNLQEIHGRIVKPGMKVLDLMASWQSHLSGKKTDFKLTGIGMNIDELEANPLLSKKVIHNLNDSPLLPFESSTFDVVICTVSVEYLINPVAVLEEVQRILKPEGIVIITVSDRWFPGKEVLFWKDLHSFERQGYCIQLLHRVAGFTDIRSESVRGYPRPEDDKHFGTSVVSDPLFTTWAKKRETVQ